MGYVGDEVGFHHFCAGQFLCHGVEVFKQDLKLVLFSILAHGGKADGEVFQQLAAGKRALWIGKQLEQNLKLPECQKDKHTIHRSADLIFILHQIPDD